jgi:hypothetical protein
MSTASPQAIARAISFAEGHLEHQKAVLEYYRRVGDEVMARLSEQAVKMCELNLSEFRDKAATQQAEIES